MPTSSPPQDRYSQALLTLRSVYQSYLAPTIPAPIATVVDTIFATAIQAQPYMSQLTSLFGSLVSTISGSSGGSAESTALLTTAIMIVTLYVSLRVFNYFRRMVMGWVIFAIKLILVLIVVQIGFYANTYGWANVFRHASWLGEIVWGFVEEALEGNKDGQRSPRGTRSRASVRKGGQYGYQGRDQVPVGGRARWT